jgi:hypothetical protein
LKTNIMRPDPMASVTLSATPKGDGFQATVASSGEKLRPSGSAQPRPTLRLPKPYRGCDQAYEMPERLAALDDKALGRPPGSL